MLRVLWALPFLAAVGCSGPDLSTSEGIQKALLEAREDLLDVLEGITDKDSAEAAKPALMRIAERESRLLAAYRKLGLVDSIVRTTKPDGSTEIVEERASEWPSWPALRKLDSKFDDEMERLWGDPGTWAVVEPMMEEYFAVADPDLARSLQARFPAEARAYYVREMITRLQASGNIPMKGGALDVYALVRSGKVGRQEYYIFRQRLNGAPTDEEIARGDYTNFPYERYRGSGNLDPARPVPLLWDREPEADGHFIVGLSDGSAQNMDKDELAKALGK